MNGGWGVTTLLLPSRYTKGKMVKATLHQDPLRVIKKRLQRKISQPSNQITKKYIYIKTIATTILRTDEYLSAVHDK